MASHQTLLHLQRVKIINSILAELSNFVFYLAGPVEMCICFWANSYTLLTGTSSSKEGQMTGVYDLVAVLTHKGRSADSGHYVAWVKQENGELYKNHY